MPVYVNCNYCGKKIKKSPSQVHSKNYCNMRCYSKTGVWVEANCLNCNKFFKRRGRKDRKDKHKFCSKLCAYDWFKGKPKNKSKRIIKWHLNTKGYLCHHVNIWDKEKTKRVSRRVLQHRYIVEHHIGRKLKIGEIIHHLNGVKTDNRIENLVICCNRSHHLFIKALKERILALENNC